MHPTEEDLPTIPAKEVRILWHDDYWDGMMSGVAKLNGEMLWFVFEHETPDRSNRLFILHRLDPADMDYMRDRHAAFREHVGTHTDYDDESGNRAVGSVHPRERRDRFYDDPRWKREDSSFKSTPIAKFWES